MILLAIALPVLIGVLVVWLLWPGPVGLSPRSLLTVSLGVGAGFGVCSCLYFLWLMLAGSRTLGLAIVELLILAVLAAAAYRLSRRHPRGEPPAPPGARIPFWLTLAFAGSAALALAIFALSSLTNPDGGWDAFAIWNLRARFLFRGAEWLRDAFSPQIPWTHPDYPLLVPGIIAMSWAFSGGESTLGPLAVALLFVAATAGVLVAALALLRGWVQALVAGTLFLGTGTFVLLGSYQYGDVPLAFYVLASLALLCVEDRYPDVPALSALAGATAGFGAWTKNEGLLFVAAIVIARGFSLARFAGARTAARQISVFAAGLFPVLAVLAIFKIGFAPPNDLLQPQAGKTLFANVTDFWRYVTVLTAFGKQAWSIGGFLLPIILVLAVYLYLVKPRVEPGTRVTAYTLLLTLALLLAGDFGVYQFLSYALDFQLTTSLDRVLLQLWPAAILAFFLLVKTPQLEARVEEKPKAAKRSHKSRHSAAETR